MKRLLSFFTFGALIVLLTGCIEIIDDLSINADGSGTFKYTVNFSSSKVKINSYLALDSLEGRRVPSKDEVIARINTVVNSLKQQEGISEVAFDANYTDYVFKLSFDFQSINGLQAAIKEVVRKESKEKTIKELDASWVSISDDAFNRSIPKIKIDRASQLKPEEIGELKNAFYTSITRFSDEIRSCENSTATIAKNKKAVMIRKDIYSVIQNTSILDNTIYLTD